MAKKSLVLYQSRTGNTEKVALSFKKVFDKHGWDCTLFKVGKDTDVVNPPINYNDYDFMCAGSGIFKQLPPTEIVDIMFNVTHPMPQVGSSPDKVHIQGRIVPGPKNGIVFVTYNGDHLGPKEAEPALSLLELEIEHLKFKCIGKFACPGRMRFGGGDVTERLAQWFGWTEETARERIAQYKENPESPVFAKFSKEDREQMARAVAPPQPMRGMPPRTTRSWHLGIDTRPNERDLEKAEIFLEEILEDNYEGLE
jgi:hypothetical protein